MQVLGVDPGSKGALALYRPRERVRKLEVLDMPTYQQGEIDYVDDLRIEEWLSQFDKIDHAFLENVNAFPPMIKGKRVKIGTSTALKIGDRAAVVRTVIRMMRIPLTRVVPRVWKGALGLASKENMRDRELMTERDLARQFVPSHAHLFQRAMDDGRADAALIAIWGARKLGYVD